MDTDFRTSSVLIGLGSVMFLVAAFLPVSRVYVEPDPEKKLEIILDLKGMWNLSSGLFGAGSLVMVIGWALFVFSFNELSKVIIPLASIILLGTGALLWTWHVTERILHPEGFAKGTNTPYLFWVYSMLTQIGLFLAGWFLLRMPLANWPGWMLIAGSVLLFILMVVFKDMPPFVYYLLTLVLAITLFTQSG
ncbi:MAG: hypothetical protein ACWGNV_09425 [Bacteroidales bacterium]